MTRKYSFYTRPIALFIAVALFFGLSGCKCDDCKDPDYTIPTTYDFENVSYSGQTARLDMMEEMTAYMKTGNTPGTIVEAQALRDMFENTNAPFSQIYEKDLKSKCFLSDVALIESYFDSLELASNSNVAGADGVAGVVTSNDGNSQYLCSANGVEYTQVIEKTLMGAVFYYQATGVYLSEDKIGASVDNTTIEPGEGTEMEHHWDEAFGYFGVPTNFPLETSTARFHGKYCNSRDALLGCNKILMDAFLAGRAAITHKDEEGKDAQIPVIRSEWERVIAATAIHYINGAKADFADDALRNHQLSEAIAFIYSLKYNPAASITNTEIQTALDFIGDNFYQVTLAGLDQARDYVSAIFDMESIKTQL